MKKKNTLPYLLPASFYNWVFFLKMTKKPHKSSHTDTAFFIFYVTLPNSSCLRNTSVLRVFKSALLFGQVFTCKYESQTK